MNKPLKKFSRSDFVKAMRNNPILHNLHSIWMEDDEASFGQLSIAGCVMLSKQVSKLQELLEQEIAQRPARERE